MEFNASTLWMRVLQVLRVQGCQYKDASMRTRLRVKEVAAQKGMSMTKLHIRSEVAYGTIRKIFRDPYTEVTLSTISRLAQELGVETRDLIEDVPGDTE